MNKLGFSLIECMLYCGILALVMMLWFNGVSFFTRACFAQTCQINSVSTLYTAFDVIIRDIRKAPKNLSSWSLLSNSKFVFKLDKTNSIGWEFINGQLIRYQGAYNYENKQWAKRTKSLVLKDIEKGSFSFNYMNQQLISLLITIKSHGKTIERISYLLN